MPRRIELNDVFLYSSRFSFLVSLLILARISPYLSKSFQSLCLDSVREMLVFKNGCLSIRGTLGKQVIH